jgi:hypothetical protein
MTHRPDLTPHELVTRFEAELRRVGVSQATLIEAFGLSLGPQTPNRPPPPSASFIADPATFQAVLDVLERLPDSAGREALISAMKSLWR